MPIFLHELARELVLFLDEFHFHFLDQLAAVLLPKLTQEVDGVRVRDVRPDQAMSNDVDLAAMGTDGYGDILCMQLHVACLDAFGNERA